MKPPKEILLFDTHRCRQTPDTSYEKQRRKRIRSSAIMSTPAVKGIQEYVVWRYLNPTQNPNPSSLFLPRPDFTGVFSRQGCLLRHYTDQLYLGITS